MSEMRLKVPDMACGHCVAAIEGALAKVDGVAGVEAALDTKLVTVRGSGNLDPQEVLEAVRGAGYSPESV